MDMLWPTSLLFLGLVPALIAAYIWILRRRRRFAVRFSSLSIVKAAVGKQSRWRRHLPFALFLLALSSLVVAAGRPVAVVSVPAGRTTIVLAMDLSRSMCSTDIAPNRLEAAKDAARAFVEQQGPTTQIAIVAFAGLAELVQPPTNDQEILGDAIDSLIPGRRTAIGSAILKSIDTVAEIDPGVAPSVSSSAADTAPAVAEGAYAPDIIVVLTDGVSNSGPEPLDAAQQAATRGLRVYTIGYGTADNQSPMDCGDGFFNGGFGGPGFGGGFGGGGGGFRRGIDEETLKQVSSMTGGEYYSATSARELQDVFNNLPTHLITRHETTELSVVFVALGTLIVALALGLAWWWNPFG
ncbi:MAG TPA: VWA domain-containing protein [Anaerolineales bacterium]|nr:VWA domain-containing protein [Anaerolineales bacterium]